MNKKIGETSENSEWKKKKVVEMEKFEIDCHALPKILLDFVEIRLGSLLGVVEGEDVEEKTFLVEKL